VRQELLAAARPASQSLTQPLMQSAQRRNSLRPDGNEPRIDAAVSVRFGQTQKSVWSEFKCSASCRRALRRFHRRSEITSIHVSDELQSEMNLISRSQAVIRESEVAHRCQPGIGNIRRWIGSDEESQIRPTATSKRSPLFRGVGRLLIIKPRQIGSSNRQYTYFRSSSSLWHCHQK